MENLITFKEFCKLLKANTNTVKSWKKRGNLPPDIFFKIGGTLYVFQDKFEQWIENEQMKIGV